MIVKIDEIRKKIYQIDKNYQPLEMGLLKSTIHCILIA